MKNCGPAAFQGWRLTSYTSGPIDPDLRLNWRLGSEALDLLRHPGPIRKPWTLAFGKVEVPCKASTGELRRQYKNIVSRPRIYNHRGNHICTSPRNDRHRSPVAIEGDDSSMTYISIYMIQPREAQIPNTQRQMESATPQPSTVPSTQAPQNKSNKSQVYRVTSF